MLNSIIRFSLQHRLLVVAVALLALGYGGWQTTQLPVDVFPDLNRPRVTVITEAPGMAPEEVESLITFPLESVLNGATGVQAVRSSSGVGISIVWVEFDWGTNIYNDRQVVAEKLSLVSDRLPEGVRPQLAPISSIMGQILMIGMWSEGGQTSPLELRTLADWTVRQRLLTLPGVSQVFTIGGGRKQFQVLVRPDALVEYGVTLHEVEQALEASNSNVTGGYLDDQGSNELLVRSLGRVQSVGDLEKLVVKPRGDRPVLLAQVARVIEGPQVKRGDSSAYVRQPDGSFSGGEAVVLTVNKQPHVDTRRLTTDVLAALADLGDSLPDDVRIAPALYQQKQLIDVGVTNVVDALRDGAVLVVIVLLVFLLNIRTTVITLTAIPLSIVITGLVFHWLGLGINTMTLGGLAVAIGELVDDSIVDVENIFRRLRENRHRPEPKHPLLVVYEASAEVRNSIVFGTLIVVLVFLPLFALGGMEGRLFTPLGIAYVVSILASLVVSLTLTPVLSYWLLPSARATRSERESFVLRGLKWLAGRCIAFSLRVPGVVLLLATGAVAVSLVLFLRLERDFLPPFNEGSVQINLMLPPGTSLAASNQMAAVAAERLQQLPFITSLVRRSGRAELDEHAVPVNITEVIASLDLDSSLSREEILEELRDAMAGIPGVVVSVEQPLAHLISHMLSGVKAQIGIKLYGEDLSTLRKTAEKMKDAIADVPGVRDLLVEPQTMIPQLRIELDRDQLALHSLRPQDVNDLVETAMHGRTVSEVLQGMKQFDLVVRLEEPAREDIETLRRLPIELPDGGTTSLGTVARIYRSGGPNTINREQVKKRIVLQCNVSGHGVVDVVQAIQERLEPIRQQLPAGYFIQYGGQFESQQSAARVIGVLSLVSLAGVFLVLNAMFRSTNFSLQVMAALPMAFIGGVAALVITGQTLTIASMVGFISLCGIAARNGILLLNHYLHLSRETGSDWTPALVVRAGQERLAPVLMTALTSGIALVPLALSAGEPGKEILYPVATVMIGGLVTSTLLEFFVRPALFWRVGRRAGRELVARTDDQW